MKKTIATFIFAIIVAFSLGFSGLPSFTVFAQGAGEGADKAVSGEGTQVPPGAGPPATDASAFDDEPEGDEFLESIKRSGTLLPGTGLTKVQCEEKYGKYYRHEEEFDPTNKEEMRNFLACSIMLGKISFWMIPHYVVYFIEFLVGIAGIIAILFLVIGGFRYVLAGAAEGQREAAKATIRNALLGLVIVFISWVVVNTIQFMLTF